MPNQDRNPANGSQGSSYIYNQGTSPNTRVAVSQKVRLLAPVYAGNSRALHQLGVVSSFSPSQSRSIEPVRGIGYGDKIAELVPSVTEPTGGSLERSLLYLMNLWQATGYAAGVDGPVRSLAHHRWPFDMEEQMVLSSLADRDLGVANVGVRRTSGTFDGGTRSTTYPTPTRDNSRPTQPQTTGHSAVITMYEACWFESASKSYAAESGIIVESGDIKVSDTHDFSTMYGEFLASGNDPTIGQLGSIRFGT